MKGLKVDFSKIQEQPSRTIYAQLEIPEFMKGKELSSIVRVKYMRSGKIFDQRLSEASNLTEGVAYMHEHIPVISDLERFNLKTVGVFCNTCFFVCVIINLILVLKL